MNDVSRQQRRSRHRELAKLGRSAMATGLRAEPRRPDITGTALVLKAKLLEHRNARRACEAAALAHALAERSLTADSGKPAIACGSGCNFCCFSYAGIVAPEAFRLAAAVRAGRAGGLDAAMVRERSRALFNLGPEQRIGAKLACPLLEGGRCATYVDRPLVCRQATSFSREACSEEYEGINLDVRVQISSAHLAHASNAHVALLAAMRAVDLPTEAYELSSALCAALATPDAEEKWLDGADVFGHLPKGPSRPAAVEMVATRIAADIR